jgi:hypothetical protein
VGVEPFDIPPPPPPPTTKTSTEVIPAGTVQVRVAYWVDVVGVVGAVANVTTHAPSDARVDVTPLALSTVETQAPAPTDVACAAGVVTLTTVPTRTEQARTVRRIMGPM